MDDEHRTTTRHRVLKGGRIQFGGGSIDCTVRNVSDTGAALDVTSPVGIPTEFVLETDGDRRAAASSGARKSASASSSKRQGRMSCGRASRKHANQPIVRRRSLRPESRRSLQAVTQRNAKPTADPAGPRASPRKRGLPSSKRCSPARSRNEADIDRNRARGAARRARSPTGGASSLHRYPAPAADPFHRAQ